MHFHDNYALINRFEHCFGYKYSLDLCFFVVAKYRIMAGIGNIPDFDQSRERFAVSLASGNVTSVTLCVLRQKSPLCSCGRPTKSSVSL